MTRRRYVFSVPVGPEFTPRLRVTLLSLRAQAPLVRVALCDASDSDACKALADEFADIVEYRRHGPDAGQSAAINEGWREIDGDVYSWLNADDYLAPDALEKVDRIFADNREADVVYGQSLIIDEEDALIGLHPAVSPNIDDITRSNIVSQPSCFYRKAALDDVGVLNPDHHYVMDWDLWLRFYRAGKTFVYAPDVLSTVLWERGTKTSSLNRQRMSEIRALVASSGAPLTTAKTMIGFTLHHLSEYSIAGPLVKRLIGLKKTAAFKVPRTWKAIGDNREGAHIPIYWYGEDQPNAVRIVNADASVTDLPLHSEGADQKSSVRITKNSNTPVLHLLNDAPSGHAYLPEKIKLMTNSLPNK